MFNAKWMMNDDIRLLNKLVVLAITDILTRTLAMSISMKLYRKKVAWAKKRIQFWWMQFYCCRTQWRHSHYNRPFSYVVITISILVPYRVVPCHIACKCANCSSHCCYCYANSARRTQVRLPNTRTFSSYAHNDCGICDGMPLHLGAHNEGVAIFHRKCRSNAHSMDLLRIWLFHSNQRSNLQWTHEFAMNDFPNGTLFVFVPYIMHGDGAGYQQ